MFIIQKTAMKMHTYMMKLYESNFAYKKSGFSYETTKNAFVDRKIPQKINSLYVKSFHKGILIKVRSEIIDDKIKNIKIWTIFIQIILITFFGLISWMLAKNALKPMIEAVSYLDRFTKDLIHDLNTPISSILINTKMLKKDSSELMIKKIDRIEQSAKNIISLYDNLEILLDEDNLGKEEFNLSIPLNQIIETYQSIYPQIIFNFDNKEILISSNKDAIKRIIDNIISNSCKYSNNTKAIININYENNTLTIQDNGKGIKYPKKIFQRNYKENDKGYGIGMHIVHRLCSELEIKIDIKSDENMGTRILLDL